MDKEPHYRGSFIIETKQDMAAMFRRIHKQYDFLNRLFSLWNDKQWRRRSCELLSFSAGSRILDFGSGTGDFALAIRENTDVTVVALDLVPEMLQRFRSKIGESNSNWVTFLVGDGEKLPFPDNSFDGVVAGFVGRNLFDLKSGLREILRILKPGGKIGFLEFCQVKNPFVKVGTWVYFHTIVNFLGILFVRKGPRAYTYLIDTIEQFHTHDELLEVFKGVGFQHIWGHAFNFGTVALTVGEK